MKRLLWTLFIAFALTLIGCSAPPAFGEAQSAAIKRSKIIEFPISAFADLPTAHGAAEAHRVALVAAGDTWAEPTWPGAGPIDRLDGSAAGVYIGTIYGLVNGVEEPRLPDPEGAVRVNFIASLYLPDPE